MAKAGSGGGTYYEASPPLTLRATWALSLVDDVNYYVNILLATVAGPTSGDFGFIGSTTTGATQFDYVYDSLYVQNGSYNQQAMVFTFKIQVILRSTGAVIDSSTSTGSAISMTIGTCNTAV